MLVINRREVETLLDPDILVEALAPAMAELSAGGVSLPPRQSALVPEHGGALLSMPVFLPSPSVLAAKLVSMFPGNAASGLPTHMAVLAVFDPRTGAPTAIMDAESVTAIRTAAGSALATRLLARPGPAVLAVLGTGVQAAYHARAIPRVVAVTEVRVAGRDFDKAAALSRSLEAELDAPVIAVPTYGDALAGADIVCATTHSTEPVVQWQWLKSGAHVNSVGLNPEGREVDDETVVKALVVVESRAAALAPLPSGATDIKEPIRNGLITEDHIYAEVGELVAGSHAGRASARQVTLYKSVGVAVQDAVAADLVLASARERGMGTRVEL